MLLYKHQLYFQITCASLVMYFNYSVDTLVERLLAQPSRSPEEDNEDAIRKKIAIYEQQIIPVVDLYKNMHKLDEVIF